MIGLKKAESLRSRIWDTLEKGYGKILLTDDYVAWTGQDVLARTQKLIELIETCAPPGSAVAISFPNLAVQALTILAVIMSGRVPIVLSFSDAGDLGQRLQLAQASMLLTTADIGNLSSAATPCAVLLLRDRERSDRCAINGEDPGSCWRKVRLCGSVS